MGNGGLSSVDAVAGLNGSILVELAEDWRVTV
jgi:hypothetical protein